MTRSTIRSYSVVAVLALSSLFSLAAENFAGAKATPTSAKTEQICQAYPEYSCVEVPTVYGYQSAKQAKQQKLAARKAKAAQKNSAASSYTSNSNMQPQSAN